jgi:hypothetical protein
MESLNGVISFSRNGQYNKNRGERLQMLKLNMELNMISLFPTKTIEQHHDDVF